MDNKWQTISQYQNNTGTLLPQNEVQFLKFNNIAYEIFNDQIKYLSLIIRAISKCKKTRMIFFIFNILQITCNEGIIARSKAGLVSVYDINIT